MLPEFSSHFSRASSCHAISNFGFIIFTDSKVFYPESFLKYSLCDEQRVFFGMNRSSISSIPENGEATDFADEAERCHTEGNHE